MSGISSEEISTGTWRLAILDNQSWMNYGREVVLKDQYNCL